jgi:hypothetical protein
MPLMDSANQLFTGLIGLFLLACVITLTIYWLIFPWLMIKKANEIIAELRRLEKLVHNAADLKHVPGEPLPPPVTLDPQEPLRLPTCSVFRQTALLWRQK